MRPLNEGRSLNSGDTGQVERNIADLETAQRRPESELRRHVHYRMSTSCVCGSLNEGRSLNSGDTFANAAGVVCVSHFAQRRPESELRRHKSEECK